MSGDRPLAGLSVVECASFVAGPTAGLALAQLGAEVIRVDPLGGAADHHRWPVAPGGESHYWGSLNKGKRSVALDLRTPDGRELLVALVAAPGPDRGVLVDNVVGRRWMDDAVLRAARPDLVHVRVQGHPSGRPAVDYTVNAEVGVPLLTGRESDAEPVNHVLPAWDLVTGHTVATAVLAALHARARTGAGAHVEVALADVALAGVADLGWLSEVADRGVDRPRHGNHVYGSFGVDFGCRDGDRVMVVALTGNQWEALHRVTGTTAVFAALERALDADLTRESDRYRLRETVAAVLRPWFAARTLAEVRRELDAAHVLWGTYRSLRDVVAAHRAGEHAVLADTALPGGAPTITGRSPLRWDGEHGDPGTPPALGADTADVLVDVLGLSAADVAGLAEAGVVPTPDPNWSPRA